MSTSTERAGGAFGGHSGDNYPRLDSRRMDRETKAVIDKLVRGNDLTRATTARSNRGIQAPDIGMLERISSVTAGSIQDAKSIFQMLPDTELAMQILVSVILSPNDMVKVELNYTVEQTAFDGAVVGALLDRVKDYFTNSYKIVDILSKILQDGLFLTGSYPLLVLPENSLDEAINSPSRVTMESISDQFNSDGSPKSIGILGNPREGRSTGMESLFEDYRITAYNPKVEPFQVAGGSGSFDPLLAITDNPSVLKAPMLRNKIQQDRVQDALSNAGMGMHVRRRGLGVESRDHTLHEGSLYRNRRYKAVPVLPITPPSHLRRKTIGHPMVQKVPSECVIPVHMPSNPEEHLGYFLLLDEQGHFLVHARESDYYTDLSTNINANNEMVSQLLATTKRMTEGRQTSKQNEIEELNRIYSDLLEETFLSRLRHGVYGNDVAVSRPQELYRIMFARSCARMHTQALYVPRELMTYIAFDYNQYGVGTSLLQNSKIIGGMRAMLLFAHTMADVKNSVGRTRLNIQLDPNDPDPSTTVEFLIHEHAKTRQASYPLGANNPIDLVSFLQNAAIDVAVSGNTAYPETKMDVEDKPSNRVKPDQDLENSLRDRHLMSMGLSPETVTAGANAEFATTIVQNNLLLTKRVLIYQKTLTSFLDDFIQKYILNSGTLMQELRDIMEENKDKLSSGQKNQLQDNARTHARRMAAESGEGEEDIFRRSAALEARRPDQVGSREIDDGVYEVSLEQLLLDFVSAIRVTLPSPDTSSLENQMKAFDTYVEALDKALSAWIDTSFMETSSMGELAEFVEPAKSAARAHYIRQWLRKNNVLAELDDLTTSDEDGSPVFNLWETNEAHVEGLAASMEKYIRQLAEVSKKRNERMDALKADTGLGTAGGSSDGGDGGGTDDDFGSLDGGDGGGDGGGSLDLDADLGAGDGLGDASDDTASTTDADTTTDDTATDDTASADTTATPAAATTDSTPPASTNDDLNLDNALDGAETEPATPTASAAPAAPAAAPQEDDGTELSLDDHVAKATASAPAAPAPAPAPAEPSLDLDDHLASAAPAPAAPASSDDSSLDLDQHLEAAQPKAPPADPDQALDLDDHLKSGTPPLKVPPPPKR